MLKPLENLKLSTIGSIALLGGHRRVASSADLLCKSGFDLFAVLDSDHFRKPYLLVEHDDANVGAEGDGLRTSGSGDPSPLRCFVWKCKFAVGRLGRQAEEGWLRTAGSRGLARPYTVIRARIRTRNVLEAVMFNWLFMPRGERGRRHGPAGPGRPYAMHSQQGGAAACRQVRMLLLPGDLRPARDRGMD